MSKEEMPDMNKIEEEKALIKMEEAKTDVELAAAEEALSKVLRGGTAYSEDFDTVKEGQDKAEVERPANKTESDKTRKSDEELGNKIDNDVAQSIAKEKQGVESKEVKDTPQKFTDFLGQHGELVPEKPKEDPRVKEKVTKLRKASEQAEDEEFEVVNASSPKNDKEFVKWGKELVAKDADKKEIEKNIDYWKKELEEAEKDTKNSAGKYIAKKELEKYKKDFAKLNKTENPAPAGATGSNEAPKPEGSEGAPQGDAGKKAEEEKKKKEEAAKAAKAGAGKTGGQSAGTSGTSAYNPTGGTLTSQSFERTSNWFNISNTENLLAQLESVEGSSVEIDDYIKAIAKLTEEGQTEEVKLKAAQILRAKAEKKINKANKGARANFMKLKRGDFNRGIKQLKEQVKKSKNKVDKEALKFEIRRQRSSFREFSRGAKDRGLLSSGWAWNPANWFRSENYWLSNRLTVGPKAPSPAETTPVAGPQASRVETPTTTGTQTPPNTPPVAEKTLAPGSQLDQLSPEARETARNAAVEKVGATSLEDAVNKSNK